MTDNAPSTPSRPPARQRRSLYRTVLSLAIAAIAATWLPFSFLYINALSKHAATVAATPATVTATPARPAPVTATSATPAAPSSSAAARPAAATLATVTTRTS
jgi:hypothetical protein